MDEYKHDRNDPLMPLWSLKAVSCRIYTYMHDRNDPLNAPLDGTVDEDPLDGTVDEDRACR